MAPHVPQNAPSPAVPARTAGPGGAQQPVRPMAPHGGSTPQAAPTQPVAARVPPPSMYAHRALPRKWMVSVYPLDRGVIEAEGQDQPILVVRSAMAIQRPLLGAFIQVQMSNEQRKIMQYQSGSDGRKRFLLDKKFAQVSAHLC